MDQVEQITKEPEQKTERIKDPKKVAAGKRLAERNKKAKQALLEKEEAHQVDDSGWMPQMSLTTAVALVGITLTAVDLYFRFNNKPTADSRVMIVEKPEPPKVEKAQPRIGME